MNPTYLYEVIPTVFGPMTVVVNTECAVTELWTEDLASRLESDPAYSENAAATEEPRKQLLEYLEGTRRQFELALKPAGTPFQKRVWAELLQIPYGETWTYGTLAKRISNPNASRAVGKANGSNPISILIPCHRVIGGSGALIGYGGGLPMKQRLLELEGVLLPLR